MVTGYHWLPEFCLRIVTGYHWLPEFRLRVVTGYHWLPEFWSQIGNRLPLVTKFDDLDRLSSVTNFLTQADVPTQLISAVYRLPAVTKKSKFFW